MTQPLRALCILLVFLGYALVVDRQTPYSAEASGETDASEPLFYTVQIGSYNNEKDAQEWYDLLNERLPAEQRKFLRIEKITPFVTVRIGKSEKRQEVLTLFEETQKITKRPAAIIHGYYRPQRITKLYDPTAPPEQPSTEPVVSAPSTTKAQRIPSPPQQSPPQQSPPQPAAPQKDRPKKPPESSPEEPLDTPVGAMGEGPAKTNLPRSPKKEALAPVRPAPPVKIPDATLKKMIIDKYLADQDTATFDKEAAGKKSQSFPENPSCVTSTCHAAIKANKNSHSPVQTGRCQACHQQVNQNHPVANGPDFQLVAKGGELCNRCHPKLTGKKYTHAPAAKGECLKCHAPHGGGNPFLLNVAAENQDKLCLTCHDKQITSGKFVHGPVGLGACSYCHDPHESDSQALLKKDPQALCFECHTDIAKGMKESTSIHQVVQTEGCSTCHSPHVSEFPFLLKQNGDRFCFTCHPAIEEKLRKSKSKHAGLYLEKQCGTCHQPHYSPFEKLLNTKELDLCLGCHSDQNSTRSKSSRNIATELKKTYLHEPLANGQCSVCHDPHGSKFLKMLAGPYPDTFYAPYDPEMYDLCFTCHDKELLTAPATETATSFRNGSQNLHYLHAAIPRKGRTCQTCHQSHSSDGPMLINQMGISFGEWRMSISFTTTGNGGSCMPGCHRKMEYTRDQEFNNSVKETEFGEYHVEYETVK